MRSISSHWYHLSEYNWQIAGYPMYSIVNISVLTTRTHFFPTMQPTAQLQLNTMSSIPVTRNCEKDSRLANTTSDQGFHMNTC